MSDHGDLKQPLKLPFAALHFLLIVLTIVCFSRLYSQANEPNVFRAYFLLRFLESYCDKENINKWMTKGYEDYNELLAGQFVEICRDATDIKASTESFTYDKKPLNQRLSSTLPGDDVDLRLHNLEVVSRSLSYPKYFQGDERRSLRTKVLRAYVDFRQKWDQPPSRIQLLKINLHKPEAGVPLPTIVFVLANELHTQRIELEGEFVDSRRYLLVTEQEKIMSRYITTEDLNSLSRRHEPDFLNIFTLDDLSLPCQVLRESLEYRLRPDDSSLTIFSVTANSSIHGISISIVLSGIFLYAALLVSYAQRYGAERTAWPGYFPDRWSYSAYLITFLVFPLVAAALQGGVMETFVSRDALYRRADYFFVNAPGSIRLTHYNYGLGTSLGTFGCLTAAIIFALRLEVGFTQLKVRTRIQFQVSFIVLSIVLITIFFQLILSMTVVNYASDLFGNNMATTLSFVLLFLYLGCFWFIGIVFFRKHLPHEWDELRDQLRDTYEQFRSKAK